MEHIIKRLISTEMIHRFSYDPLIVVSGARQVGKTTLCDDILPTIMGLDVAYITFDDPDERMRFKNGAIQILENIQEQLIVLDEVQKIPEIFDAVKVIFDKQKRLPLEKRQYIILTGSSQLLLLKNVKESLAGRAALYNLFPFSFSEITGSRFGTNFLATLLAETIDYTSLLEEVKKNVLMLSPKIKREILSMRENHQKWGGYPVVHQRPGEVEKSRWLADYRNTYLEKDVAEIGNVENIDTFARVQRILASRASQILNISEIAKDLGLAVNTVKRYIHLLEVSFQCFKLLPFYENTTKRLVKSPKIYFSDNGLLQTILGDFNIDSGAFYENWVFMELYKWKKIQPIEPELYFYRTAAGMEIDFLISTKDQTIPIEVKLSSKPQRKFAASIKSFMSEHPKAGIGLICYQGDEIIEVEPNIWAIPDWVLFL